VYIEKEYQEALENIPTYVKILYPLNYSTLKQSMKGTRKATSRTMPYFWVKIEIAQNSTAKV
jgi:hypothetical protein